MSALLFAACASFFALPAQASQVVVKSTGVTTPNLQDFPLVYANRAGEIGYRNVVPHKLFLETFPVRCGPHQRGVSGATFSVTLKKLTSTTSGAMQTQLSFWDSGAAHFNTQVWAPSDPAGTTRVFSYNVAGLPPAGGMVHINHGAGLRLLRDRDFSFSVTHDASVLSAKLVYDCNRPATHAPDSTAGGTFSDAHTMPPGVVATSPNGASGGRVKFSTTFSTPSDTPCPRLNSAHGRSLINSLILMRRIAPNADTVCTRRGAPNGFSQIVFTFCAMDARGPSHGLITRAIVTCDS